MCKIACIVFEVEEERDVEALINHIEKFNPRLVFTASQLKNDEVAVEERYSALMIKLGIENSLVGYDDLKKAIEIFHRMPHGKMKNVYDIAEKEAGKPTGTMDTNIRYVVKKLVSMYGVQRLGQALGLTLSENIKITNKNFIRYIHDAVYLVK